MRSTLQSGAQQLHRRTAGTSRLVLFDLGARGWQLSSRSACPSSDQPAPAYCSTGCTSHDHSDPIMHSVG